MEHHAQVYYVPTLALTHLPPYLQTPSTDVEHFVEDTLSIATVRSLITQATVAPLVAPERYLVVVARRLTREAQNALLKILEEPPSTTRLVLVVPSASHVLPTIRSRVAVVSAPTNAATESPSRPDFLARSYQERLALIQKLHTNKDTAGLRSLITEITTYMGTHASRHRLSRETVQAVEQAARYAAQSGASHKMLSEHLALLLPIVTTE